MERLHKALAHAGVASRRACEEMISSGRVTVNGRVVTTLGTQVTPGIDVLAVDGRVVQAAPPPVYIMVNKPVGYVSTTSDPQSRPTVLDLVKKMDAARLYPVGRLDVDSEGLLILTNDGALTQRLTHPSFAVEKEYLALVEGQPGEADLAALRAGVPLDGRPAPVDAVSIVEQSPRGSSTTLLRVVIHEGRQREVRRLFDAIGYRVQRLQRVRQGSLMLGDLPSGGARRLSGQEVAQLLRPVRRTSARSAQPAAAQRSQHGRQRAHAAPDAGRNDHQDTRRAHAAPHAGRNDHHDTRRAHAAPLKGRNDYHD